MGLGGQPQTKIELPMISGAHCRISLRREESGVSRVSGCGNMSVELRDTSRSEGSDNIEETE